MYKKILTKVSITQTCPLPKVAEVGKFSISLDIQGVILNNIRRLKVKLALSPRVIENLPK